MKTSLALSVVFSAALVACGGGGSSPTASVTPPTTPVSSGTTSPVSDPVITPVTPPVVTPPATENLPELTTIPDPVFRAALASYGIQANGFNQVSTAQILVLTQMNISRDGYTRNDGTGNNTFGTGAVNLIRDLTGLENFRNLVTLRIENQAFTSIDVTKLVKLDQLSVWQAPITSIDVSKNVNLRILGVSETSMTNIDLPALPNLVEADLQQDEHSTKPYTTGNGTTVYGYATIGLSHVPALQRLYVYGNRLSSLDFSANRNISEIWANDNQLASLNVNGYSNVTYLVLYNNKLVTLDIRGIAGGSGVPYRLYTNGNPFLNQITVDKSAETTINYRFSATAAGQPLGYEKDSWTSVLAQ